MTSSASIAVKIASRSALSDRNGLFRFASTWDQPDCGATVYFRPSSDASWSSTSGSKLEGAAPSIVPWRSSVTMASAPLMYLSVNESRVACCEPVHSGFGSYFAYSPSTPSTIRYGPAL